MKDRCEDAEKERDTAVEDYQEMKDRCEDAEKERDTAVEDNVSHEKLEDELREEISELKGVVARLTETK